MSVFYYIWFHADFFYEKARGKNSINYTGRGCFKQELAGY